MPPFQRTSSVCLRCLLQRRQTSTTATISQNKLNQRPDPFPPASGKVRLDTRRLVSIHGSDASRFLQGLTTNSVRPHQTDGWYCAFLSATGRVLWDAFVYPVHWSRRYRYWLNGGREGGGGAGVVQDTQNDPGYLVEVDATEVDAFVRHLKRHKLRAKVSVRPVESDAFSVWSVWRTEERWTPHRASLAAGVMGGESAGMVGTGVDAAMNPDSVIQLVDSRAPGFGRRLVLFAGDGMGTGTGTRSESRSGSRADEGLAQSFADLPDVLPRAYQVRRYLYGIPEGSAEIHRDAALPLEHNIDYMGGIDFRKGCYIGQELTIRTHHTGVVRKRMLPVALYPSGEKSTSAELEPPAQLEYDDGISSQLSTYPPAGTDMKKVGGKGRSAGRWVAGVGNIGLGLCRLEMMTDIRLTAETPQWSPEQRFEMQWMVDGVQKQVGVKAFVPEWHRGKERVRSPPKRVG